MGKSRLPGFKGKVMYWLPGITSGERYSASAVALEDTSDLFYSLKNYLSVY